MRIPDALAAALLKKTGLYSDEQIAELYAESERQRRPLQDLIVRHKLMSQTELTRLYAEELGLPFIELKRSQVKTDHLDALGERLSKKYRVAVFDENEGTQLVAIEDPGNVELVELLKKELGNNLKLHVTTPEAIQDTLARYHSSIKLHEVLPDPEAKLLAPTKASIDNSSAISQTINTIIENAITDSASDIHIEPREDLAVVRYRIDGVLKEAGKFPLKFHDVIVSQIKLMAQVKGNDTSAHEGKFSIGFNDQTYLVRVTTLPLVDGEKVVLHLVGNLDKVEPLHKLGLWGLGLKDLEHVISQQHGLVLVAGTKTSGKSTTLLSILNTINEPGLNLSTVEESLTKRLVGVNQVEVSRSSGLSTGKALAATLEQDPNVIMVDEIRDNASIDLSLQAAASGHLVLASLYAGSSVKAITHLSEMGVKPYMVASSLRLVVSEKLVRRLCLHCREVYRPDAVSLKALEKDFDISLPNGFKHLHEIESLAIEEGLGKSGDSRIFSTTRSGITRLYRARKSGCNKCHNSGYKGRVGLYEVLMVSETIQKNIASGVSPSQLEKTATKEGMLNLKLDGLVKVLRGLTSLEEVLRAN